MYEVSEIKQINFGATGTEEILQNVAFILSTFKNSCPLDRDFGYDPPVDVPIEIGEQLAISRIIEAVNEYEPRAQIVEVEVISEPQQGNIKVKARVAINDESI